MPYDLNYYLRLSREQERMSKLTVADEPFDANTIEPAHCYEIPQGSCTQLSLLNAEVDRIECSAIIGFESEPETPLFESQQ